MMSRLLKAHCFIESHKFSVNSGMWLDQGVVDLKCTSLVGSKVDIIISRIITFSLFVVYQSIPHSHYPSNLTAHISNLLPCLLTSIFSILLSSLSSQIVTLLTTSERGGY